MKSYLSAFLFFCFLFCSTIGAQSPDAPASFLGYEVGKRFTPLHRVVDYYEHLAQTFPDKMQLVSYGKTYEQRELMVAILSSSDNMARLEQIRTTHLADAGFGDGVANGEIPIVWLSFNVHGNEASATEAALEVVYDLLSQPEAQKWLEKMVVIIDPCLNPDGRERYVTWYNQMLGVTPNVARTAREHNEGWPNGRVNHYMFDLNRDWVWATQIETQQRVQLYKQWLPHVHADVHEMDINSPYFFPTAAEPIHHAITPWQKEFQEQIGKNLAQTFDANGWRYFTAETFDLFYPGYGDTFPMFNGAIGMTYEKGGGGSAGLMVNTREGNALTLFNRKEEHRVAVLKTVETAFQHATQLLREFKRFYQPETHRSPFQNVVITQLKGDKKQALLQLLSQNDIFVREVAQNKTVFGYNYQTRKNETVAVQAGDLLVSVKQPKSVLTRVLFEPNPVLNDSLTYDITSWALPYIYQLNAVATSETVATQALDILPQQANTTDGYAFLLPWNDFGSAKALGKLLNADFQVHYLKSALKVGTEEYPMGSLLVFKKLNQAKVPEGSHFATRLQEITGATFLTLQSGRTSPNLGSDIIGFIAAPRVALFAGRPAASLGVGEIWHYFDQEIQYPVTLFRPEEFSSLNLDDFNVLILADGRYSSVLNETQWAKIGNWVAKGGKLITVEGATESLVGKEGVSLKLVDLESGESPTAFSGKDRTDISESAPGAIFEVTVDTTHPLGYGLQPIYYTLSQNSTLYSPLASGWTVGKSTENAHVAGFVGSRLKARSNNSFVFGVEEKGNGNMVYFRDNPLFRGFWYSGKLLFANAVFMVGN